MAGGWAQSTNADNWWQMWDQRQTMIGWRRFHLEGGGGGREEPELSLLLVQVDTNSNAMQNLYYICTYKFRYKIKQKTQKQKQIAAHPVQEIYLRLN